MCCVLNPNRIKHFRSPNAGQKKGSVGAASKYKGIPLSSEHRAKISSSLKGRTDIGRGSTPEIELLRIQKIKEKAIQNNGGLRLGSGRGKKGWYKGIFCDSSWELAFVIYHLDHKIQIQRCSEKRNYVFENKNYKYYPDFVVDNKIYELKGYFTDKTHAKMSQNSDIILIDKLQIVPYINYVQEKYGKNFIDLYEEGQPDWRREHS